ADHAKFLGHQGSDRDVDSSRLPRGSRQTELVQIVNAGALAETIELLRKLALEDFAQRLAQHLRARQRVHNLHLRIPPFDLILQIDGEHADVDGFDDVFVEVFQALVLGNLLLERRVKPRILNGDGQIAGQGLQQFDVFTGEEIPFYGLAKPEERNRALL